MVQARAVRVLLMSWTYWLAVVAPANAQKTDVVELVNGDRITCEIQKLDRGKLTVKTDGIGTISIEWDDVTVVTSTAQWDVELASGMRLTGSIARGMASSLNLVTSVSAEPIPLATIVRLTRLGRTFWRRLDGSLSAGFSFTQADLSTQSTFDASFRYRTHRWLMTLGVDSLVSSHDEADRQTRNDVTLQVQRFVRPRRSFVALAVFQQNEELGLKLRSVLGGGLVHTIEQSNRSVLQVQAGASYTQEQYAAEDGESIAEVVSGLGWDWFTFDGRSTNIDFAVLTFVALRRDSRFRLELNASFKSDIVSDLYWSVNAFESYNGDPPEGRKKNDFGISAGLGWSF